MNQANEFKFTEEKDRNFLRSVLKDTEVNLTFQKTNGEIRVMRCTLKEGLVGSYEKKTERAKKENSDVQPVFDLDKKEWRSFRWDSIKEIRFTIE